MYNILKTPFLVLLIAFAANACNPRTEDADIAELREENAALKAALETRQSVGDQVELNKEIVTEFFREVFVELQLDSIHKYIGDKYIQHDPEIPDGKQALIDVMQERFKEMQPNQVDIMRVFAEDDLVFIHTRNDTGQVVLSIMHVFRMENNKIVEHWISVQAVPETSANDNTLF